MDSLLGILRVRTIRGVNLAFRDACGSDPYIVLRLGHQDMCSHDDRMGDAEFEIQSFVEVVKMDLSGVPNGTILTIVKPWGKLLGW